MSTYPQTVAVSREIDAVVNRYLASLEAARRVAAEGLSRDEIESELVKINRNPRRHAQRRGRELTALLDDVNLAEERPLLEQLAMRVIREYMDRHHLTSTDLADLDVPAHIIDRVTQPPTTTSRGRSFTTTL